MLQMWKSTAAVGMSSGRNGPSALLLGPPVSAAWHASAGRSMAKQESLTPAKPFMQCILRQWYSTEKLCGCFKVLLEIA
jgi:hypothetical protein